VAEFLKNSADNSVNSTEFRSSKIFLFLSHVNCISAEFSRFSTNFSKFFKMRRNRWETIFHCSPNFVTLLGTLVSLILKSWRITRKGSPKPRAGVPSVLQRIWPCRRAGKWQTVDADFVSCTSPMLQPLGGWGKCNTSIAE
jgi:hypothetical protein